MGADILDKTNTNAYTFGRLKEEQTWWQLEPAQRVYFDEVDFSFSSPTNLYDHIDPIV